MADKHYTYTTAVDYSTLLAWSEHQDSEKLMGEAKAVFTTASLRDRLMNDISEHRSYLGMTSLNWLATATEAPLCAKEHLDRGRYWCFVWILYRLDIHASIEGLDELLHLAAEKPYRFDASAEMVKEALDWDSGRDADDFAILNPSGDGDEPMYVLSALLTFKRLLNFAKTQGLIIVHMRYAFRPAL